MNGVNQTLYIPLYGKAYVSRRGIILRDPRAEEIWEKAGFPLKGKSTSRWLACYMGMRAAVFDRWLKEKLTEAPDAVVLHIGCGMDSRVDRVGTLGHRWFDIDFPAVIAERKRWYRESADYRMVGTDVRTAGWLEQIAGGSAVVIMEGVSMYLRPEELKQTLGRITAHFGKVSLLMDCYSELAAKASRVKNPVNDVGVTQVYGLDDPKSLVETGLCFVGEHDMTPESLVDELHGLERTIFRTLYAGGFAKRLYRLYEYKMSR